MPARPPLTRSLVLEARADAPDGLGGHRPIWTPLGRLWAEVAPATVQEAALAGMPAVRRAHRVTVRAAPPGAPSRPTPGQRLRDGALTLAILAVEPADPQGRFLRVLAVEEAAR